ncbi:hypothetical protein MHYP_G00284540 [Metynnis hypsauchen]
MNVYEDAPSASRMESECVKTEDECVKTEDECVKTEDESVKTEDLYQTLQPTPPVENPNPTHEPVRSFRVKTKLMVFNTLLLIVILILIGVFLSKHQQSADLSKPQAPACDVAAAENQQTTEVSRKEDAE